MGGFKGRNRRQRDRRRWSGGVRGRGGVGRLRVKVMGGFDAEKENGSRGARRRRREVRRWLSGLGS